jgi:hypothetical protein
MRVIVTCCRKARIKIGAITSWINRQTRKLTTVTTIAIGDIAVVAFFVSRRADKKIAALVWTANAHKANLPIVTRRSVDRFIALGARMIVQALFVAITWIFVVAFRVARRRARVVARKAAIGFAAIGAHHIAIVTCLKILDFAIAANPSGSSTAHTPATNTAFAANATSTRLAGTSRGVDGYFTIATTTHKNSRSRKAKNGYQGRKPP